MNWSLPKIVLLVTALSVLFSSCRKYEEEIIKNNEAPPDYTVSLTTIENYINKSYISVLGREPDSLEFETAYNGLKAGNLSFTSRDNFLNNILNQPEYNAHIYNINNIDLLNNLDTNEITTHINLFQFLLTDSSYAPFWNIIQYEIDRLIAMQQINYQLQNGTVGIVDLHHTFVNNYFYDQINMGSLNFVVSMYQNFLRRYPSVDELDQGIAMVDGNYAILFSQTGHSKDDFMNIFFSSTDYYEGQVRDLYLRYLFREPTTIEATQLTIEYKNSGNYKQLQKAILRTDEFIGI